LNALIAIESLTETILLNAFCWYISAPHQKQQPVEVVNGDPKGIQLPSAALLSQLNNFWKGFLKWRP